MVANSEANSSGGQDQSKKVELVQEGGKVFRKWTDEHGVTHYKQLGVAEGAQAKTSENYKKSREKAQAEVSKAIEKVQGFFTDLFTGLPRHMEFGESQKSEFSPNEFATIAFSQEDSSLAKLKKKISQRVGQTRKNLGKQTKIISEDVDAIEATEEYFRQIKEKSGNA